MKSLQKRCSKCCIKFTLVGGVPINFCQFCGNLLEINAKDEQPFHLDLPDDDWESIRGMARKGANHVNEILFEHGDHMDVHIIKSLKQAARLLDEISKDAGTRQETRGLLGKTKEQENLMDSRLRDFSDGLIRKEHDWDQSLGKLIKGEE